MIKVVAAMQDDRSEFSENSNMTTCTGFDNDLIRDTSAILGVTEHEAVEALLSLHSGMSKRAVLFSREDVYYRLHSRRVVAKLHKERGNPKSGTPFISFHGSHWQGLNDGFFAIAIPVMNIMTRLRDY